MILRICVCIPTYNNPRTIASVVRGVLGSTPFPVLLVDDGSSQPVEEILADEGLVPNPRLQIKRFAENRGKGVALQEAIGHCVRQGFTHMVSIDGDGQHYPEEIMKLCRAAQEKPWNLILGCRQLVGDNVPEVSKFGRKFSNFWVKFQTDLKVGDSQSGFRLYPLFEVQNMRFFTRRFDFEIEVLIRCLWRGVEITEVDVPCYYPPAHERVSHFDKFWDNVRISTLNTLLVILSLLRVKAPPTKVGVAVGIGAFIGATPFFGFHTFMAAATSFFLRLSFPYVFLGTQVSLPPFIPFLIMASAYLGNLVLGTTVGGVAGVAWHWFVGSLILGTGLGLLCGLVAWGLSHRFQKNAPQQKKAWSGKTRGGRFGNAFMKNVTRFGGLRSAYFCLNFIVPYFYLFAPKARRSFNEYWKLMQPELGWLGRQKKILAQFDIFARTLLDRIYQSHHPDIQFQTISEGSEHLLASLRAKRSVVLVGAHMGAWELAAMAFRKYELPVKFTVIRFEALGLTFHKVALDQKQGGGVETVFSNQNESPLLKVREILALGAPVGMMADRPSSQQFELLPFLGKLAAFDMTPFRVGVSCGADIAFSFGFRGKEAKTYHLFVTPPRSYRYVPGIDKSAQCSQWARDYVAAIEAHLKKFPEQWFNFFPFWSSRVESSHEEAASRNFFWEDLVPKGAPSATPLELDAPENLPL